VTRPRSKASPSGTFDLNVYLAALAPDAREAVQKLRKAISAAAPRAEEGSSYGLPAFKLDGRPLVCFAAAARHCSFYPMSPAVLRAYAADLRGYETSKGTIRFPPERPLPSALVRKLVKARIAELQPARTPPDKRSQPARLRRSTRVQSPKG